MDYLPPELLTKIFSFLDPVSILTCRQVCRRWKVLTIRMTNPLYLPKIVAKVMQNFHLIGKLKDTLKLRLVCKLWKDGLDQLTNHDKLVLNGLTDVVVDSYDMVEGLVQQWNPFPSGIVRIKLCYGHDSPGNVAQPQENVAGNIIVERFSDYMRFLQVSLRHADCAEKHLTKVLNFLCKRLQGLVISETPSPYRFNRSDDHEPTSTSSIPNENEMTPELGQLETLRFLKLDDSDTKIRYSSLYTRIIQNAPNLQHLEINGYHHLDMEVIKLLAFRIPNKLSLTHLKMDAEDPNVQEILEVLSMSDLPLKYLSLKIMSFGNVTECATCTSLLHGALQKFGPTLERLELKLDWFQSTENPAPELLNVFPSSRFLKKLTRFKLVGYTGLLDFLKDLVSLKALMVVDFNPQSQRMFSSDQSFQAILPNLKEIHLPLQQTLYSADSSYKNKLQNFMYERDASFIQKYCGLLQEIFP